MLWKLLPLSLSLPLTLAAWILLSLIVSLIFGLLMLRRARNRNKVIESLIALSKNAPAGPKLPLVTRVK